MYLPRCALGSYAGGPAGRARAGGLEPMVVQS